MLFSLFFVLSLPPSQNAEAQLAEPSFPSPPRALVLLTLLLYFFFFVSLVRSCLFFDPPGKPKIYVVTVIDSDKSVDTESMQLGFVLAVVIFLNTLLDFIQRQNAIKVGRVPPPRLPHRKYPDSFGLFVGCFCVLR